MRLVISVLGWTLDLDLAPTPVAPDEEDDSPTYYGETTASAAYEAAPAGFRLPSLEEDE